MSMEKPQDGLHEGMCSMREIFEDPDIQKIMCENAVSDIVITGQEENEYSIETILAEMKKLRFLEIKLREMGIVNNEPT